MLVACSARSTSVNWSHGSAHLVPFWEIATFLFPRRLIRAAATPSSHPLLSPLPLSRLHAVRLDTRKTPLILKTIIGTLSCSPASAESNQSSLLSNFGAGNVYGRQPSVGPSLNSEARRRRFVSTVENILKLTSTKPEGLRYGLGIGAGAGSHALDGFGLRYTSKIKSGRGGNALAGGHHRVTAAAAAAAVSAVLEKATAVATCVSTPAKFRARQSLVGAVFFKSESRCRRFCSVAENVVKLTVTKPGGLQHGLGKGEGGASRALHGLQSPPCESGGSENGLVGGHRHAAAAAASAAVGRTASAVTTRIWTSSSELQFVSSRQMASLQAGIGKQLCAHLGGGEGGKESWSAPSKAVIASATQLRSKGIRPSRSLGNSGRQKHTAVVKTRTDSSENQHPSKKTPVNNAPDDSMGLEEKGLMKRSGARHWIAKARHDAGHHVDKGAKPDGPQKRCRVPSTGAGGECGKESSTGSARSKAADASATQLKGRGIRPSGSLRKSGGKKRAGAAAAAAAVKSKIDPSEQQHLSKRKPVNNAPDDGVALEEKVPVKNRGARRPIAKSRHDAGHYTDKGGQGNGPQKQRRVPPTGGESGKESSSARSKAADAAAPQLKGRGIRPPASLRKSGGKKRADPSELQHGGSKKKPVNNAPDGRMGLEEKVAVKSRGARCRITEARRQNGGKMQQQQQQQVAEATERSKQLGKSLERGKDKLPSTSSTKMRIGNGEREDKKFLAGRLSVAVPVCSARKLKIRGRGHAEGQRDVLRPVGKQTKEERVTKEDEEAVERGIVRDQQAQEKKKKKKGNRNSRRNDVRNEAKKGEVRDPVLSKSGSNEGAVKRGSCQGRVEDKVRPERKTGLAEGKVAQETTSTHKLGTQKQKEKKALEGSVQRQTTSKGGLMTGKSHGHLEGQKIDRLQTCRGKGTRGKSSKIGKGVGSTPTASGQSGEQGASRLGSKQLDEDCRKGQGKKSTESQGSAFKKQPKNETKRVANELQAAVPAMEEGKKKKKKKSVKKERWFTQSLKEKDHQSIEQTKTIPDVSKSGRTDASLTSAPSLNDRGRRPGGDPGSAKNRGMPERGVADASVNVKEAVVTKLRLVELKKQTKCNRSEIRSERTNNLQKMGVCPPSNKSSKAKSNLAIDRWNRQQPQKKKKKRRFRKRKFAHRTVYEEGSRWPDYFYKMILARAYKTLISAGYGADQIDEFSNCPDKSLGVKFKYVAQELSLRAGTLLRLLQSFPAFAECSLENDVRPKVEYLKSLCLKKRALEKTIGGSPSFFTLTLEKQVRPKVDTLLRKGLTPLAVQVDFGELMPFFQTEDSLEDLRRISNVLEKKIGLKSSDIAKMVSKHRLWLGVKADDAFAAISRMEDVGISLRVLRKILPHRPRILKPEHADEVVSFVKSVHELGLKPEIFTNVCGAAPWMLLQDNYLSCFQSVKYLVSRVPTGVVEELVRHNKYLPRVSVIRAKLNFVEYTMGCSLERGNVSYTIFSYSFEERIKPRFETMKKHGVYFRNFMEIKDERFVQLLQNARQRKEQCKPYPPDRGLASEPDECEGGGN